MQVNRDVKLKAAGLGVRLWEVAEAMNIYPESLSRKLRHELPPEEKEKILAIIDELAKEAS